MDWIKKNVKLTVGIAIAVVVLLIALVVINSVFALKNEGERKEQRMAQLYNQSLTSLSTCIDQGQIAAQVSEREFESLREILVDVTAARYTDSEGNDTDASQVLGGGQLFSAVIENYPTIDQRSWQNLQTVVVGCRDEFQGSQDRVQNEARSYNEWRVTDNIFNSWIKADFPSNELKVKTAEGDTLYGMAAYDRITRVVSVADANSAFESGQLDEQNLFE
jgi:hypothetical protein